MRKMYGYARVSSKDQNLDRQLIAYQAGTGILSQPQHPCYDPGHAHNTVSGERRTGVDHRDDQCDPD